MVLYIEVLLILVKHFVELDFLFALVVQLKSDVQGLLVLFKRNRVHLLCQCPLHDPALVARVVLLVPLQVDYFNI